MTNARPGGLTEPTTQSFDGLRMQVIQVGRFGERILCRRGRAQGPSGILGKRRAGRVSGAREESMHAEMTRRDAAMIGGGRRGRSVGDCNRDRRSPRRLTCWGSRSMRLRSHIVFVGPPFLLRAL
jgi:hypothetical protein